MQRQQSTYQCCADAQNKIRKLTDDEHKDNDNEHQGDVLSLTFMLSCRRRRPPMVAAVTRHRGHCQHAHGGRRPRDRAAVATGGGCGCGGGGGAVKPATASRESVERQNESCIEHKQDEQRSHRTKHDVTDSLVDDVVRWSEYIGLLGTPARADVTHSASNPLFVSLSLCELRHVVHDRQEKDDDRSYSGSSKTGRSTSSLFHVLSFRCFWCAIYVPRIEGILGWHSYSQQTCTDYHMRCDKVFLPVEDWTEDIILFRS